jgi:peptidoglycan/xylan/chitin deacetylase (PgdA/CDA1 family)
MRGHLYCSPRCAREDGRMALWRPVREALVRPVPPRLALAVLALGAAAPVLLALRTVGELDRLSRQAPPPPLHRPTARIENVVAGAAGARIEGSASPSGAVFLFGSGGLVASTPVREGRFRFDAVRDPGPYRVGLMPLSAESSSAATSPNPTGSTAGETPAEDTAARQPAAPEKTAPPPVRVETPTSVAVAAPASRSRPSSPPSSGFTAFPDMTRGPEDRPELVVSFDAGSTSRGARQILAALSERGIHTTIFLTGEFIRRYPDIARQVAADGHEVGNHTDSHPHLTTYAQDGRQATRRGVDRAYLAGQLRAAADAYKAATGRAMSPLWRAPFGEQNAEIRAWAALEGYWHVGWTGGRAGLDGLDWVSDPSSRAYRSADGVVERLVAHAENGGIILLHLGSDREDPVAPRVPQLLDALTKRGFQFARASRFLDRMGMTEERLLALASRGGGSSTQTP